MRVRVLRKAPFMIKELVLLHIKAYKNPNQVDLYRLGKSINKLNATDTDEYYKTLYAELKKLKF